MAGGGGGGGDDGEGGSSTLQMADLGEIDVKGGGATPPAPAAVAAGERKGAGVLRGAPLAAEVKGGGAPSPRQQ